MYGHGVTLQWVSFVGAGGGLRGLSAASCSVELSPLAPVVPRAGISSPPHISQLFLPPCFPIFLTQKDPGSMLGEVGEG